MASISNVNIYGLAESIYRSGYPMLEVAPTENEFNDAVSKIQIAINSVTYIDDVTQKHIKRAIKLANMKGGGHEQFLTGITVAFDITLSNKAWVEAERYKFLNFVSSMSTMHRISKMPIGYCCNKYVENSIMRTVSGLQKTYNAIDGNIYPEKKKEAYLKLLYNTPSGFEITAGMITNYRCLRNIFSQRKSHRLINDWGVVCDWIETLPMAKELICGGIVNES